ncbi:TPA: hypothetical protein DCG61_00560 [Patescibacteria group bacterium]|jgi:hypothetical protein|nr:hypothetical protein [Patescibacteria group bacterium]
MARIAVLRFMSSTVAFLIQFDKPFPSLHKRLTRHLIKHGKTHKLLQNSSSSAKGELVLLGYESRLDENESNEELVSILTGFCKQHQIVLKSEIVPSTIDDDD